MSFLLATYDDSGPDPVEASRQGYTPAEEARLAAMVRTHFDFVWRSLRRQGLPPDAADDSAQQVFVIASRRISQIQTGAERSFLFQTALRVGSETRRAFGRSRERPGLEAALADVQDSAPSPEEQVQKKAALEVLDEVLGSLDEKVRVPFMLFEIEGFEVKEIAELLGVPVGTVGSRLRLAREEFHAAAKRLRARQANQMRDR